MSAQDTYEWQQTERDVWTRACLGHEASASFNENIAYGHTELSVTATFRVHHPASSGIAGTDGELDDLVARVRDAWIRTRYLRPEVAVEMTTHTDASMPQAFTYRVLRDEASLRRWVEQTMVVVRLGEPGAESLEEVCAYTYNRALPTRGKQSMLYLVLPRLADEKDRNAHFVWNVSHALADGGSISELYNVLLQAMIDATPSTDGSVYIPSEHELDVLPLLPRSVVAAYRQQHKPSAADEEAAAETARDNLRLIQAKMDESLALQPVTNWTKRKHETICIRRDIEADAARELIRFGKHVKSGVTYLASAATVLATAETFPERKPSSSGALMGMVRNARRWLSTDPVEGATGNRTPLGSDAVFLWIPVDTQKSLEPSLDRLPQLVSVAASIRSELNKHLVSPHCISSYPVVADFAQGALTNHWAEIEVANRSAHTPSAEELAKIIGPQAPGFSSVGALQIHKRFEPVSPSARASGLWLERTDAAHRGRQVNASPWISMLMVDGKIKLQLGFDAKFHDAVKMEQWMQRTYEWLLVCAAAPPPTTAASSSSSASTMAPISARL